MLSCCKILFLIVLKIQWLMKIWYFLIVRLIIFLMLTVIHAGGSFSVEMKVEKKQQQKTLVISSGVWVKCVTRTRVGKPALGFYESLKIYIAVIQTR